MRKILKMFDFSRNATKNNNQNSKNKVKPTETVASRSLGGPIGAELNTKLKYEHEKFGI